jgi:hypothetical protein
MFDLQGWFMKFSFILLVAVSQVIVLPEWPLRWRIVIAGVGRRVGIRNEALIVNNLGNFESFGDCIP